MESVDGTEITSSPVATAATAGMERRDFAQHVTIRDTFNKGFTLPDFLANPARLAEILPPQSVKTFEEKLAELTEEERAAYDELIKIVREEKGWTTEEVDDWGVIRFMKARPKGVNKAVKMLDAHMDWQREVKPKEVSCTSCNADANSHMGHFVGWDSLHRPTVYSSYKWTGKGPISQNCEASVEHNIELFNNTIKLMPEGVEQWVACVDFVSYSMWTDGRSPVGRAVMDVMEAHYPERLAIQFLVDPPTTFFVLWKMLSPFIDDRTKAKVQMVYTDREPNIRDEFPKVFPPHMCEYLIETFENNKLAYAQHKIDKKQKKEGEADEGN
jgi:hypothetical protein